jgi:hypothetical protein
MPAFIRAIFGFYSLMIRRHSLVQTLEPELSFFLVVISSHAFDPETRPLF